MRILLALFASALTFSLACSSHAATTIYNVKGYTLHNGELATFVGLSYENGLITHVYATQADVEQNVSLHNPSDEPSHDVVINGGGATLIPGLIDAHGHVSSYGEALGAVKLEGSTSETEAVQRVAAFMPDAPSSPDDWIVGRGWNQVLWPTNDFPTRQTLDAVTGKTPTALSRVDGHALWVNTAALDAAGITKDSVDPEGGQILRDQYGEPTGVLIDNAMDIVFETIGEASIEALEAQILRSLNAVAATGMTAVHDAGISARELQAYKNLQSRGELPIRVYPMLSVLDPANDTNLAAGPTRTADGMLSVKSVKISADGALGSRGAALHADYSDKAGHKGLLLLSDADLRHHIRRAAAAGFQVNVHAIGDLANTRVLDELELINKSPEIKALRHRIEHAQIIRPIDIQRFNELGVIASVQPTHATSDKNMAGDRLGEARLEGAYAWQTLLESGSLMAGGSDFPVEPPDPLLGLHAAVTRTDREGKPLGGWRPQEKLSREVALDIFTEGAAYAAHEEGYLGQIREGFAADFVLLAEDYFNEPEQQIWQNTILTTVVGGKIVFAAENSPMN